MRSNRTHIATAASARNRSKKHTADDNRETIIADGAYGGSENQKLAEAHNVELITTALTGKTPDEVFAGFVFNEAGTEVVSCPVGKAPQKSTLYKKSGMLRVLMPKDCCSNCPYQKNCRAKKQKHAYAVMVSPKKVERSLYLQKLSTEEYLKLTRMRNAVEGVPSVLRRRYRVDHSPFRGKIRTGWTYALAVGAYNIRKLISSRRSPRVECAHNPAFA